MDTTPLQAMIAELEQVRQSRVVLYVGQHRGQVSHHISEDDALPLFQCLRQREMVERLDLVLHTVGGSISSAHYMQCLLQSYGKHLSVLVPHKALSAGTLLCLGAQEIVMGPFAQLGPIDPHIAQREPSGSDHPPMISSEDIRAFQHMAQSWFGIEDSQYNIQLLQLLCERIFPTSLTAFFRAAQQIETLIEQHLRVHLPAANLAQRQKIAEYFVQGCYSHDHIITRDDAREIGLNVAFPSQQEEALLWHIWETCAQDWLSTEALQIPGERGSQVLALIASTDFLARCLMNITESGTEGPQGQACLMIEKRWEIVQQAPSEKQVKLYL